MDGALVEYAVNAAWQLPVLAAGAWLLVRVARPSAAAQYRIWVGVLMLAVVLPLAGVLADSGAGRGASEGLARQSVESLAAARVEVVPAHDAAAGVAGTASPDSGQGAFGAGDSGLIGEPGGLVLGSQGAGHVSSWAGWVVAALEHVRRIELSATAAGWIAGVYLLVMLLGLVRIARAWSGARRLVRDSDADALTGGERALVEECARRMGVAGFGTAQGMGPEVRVVGDADTLAGPVVVGARRPVLLCPAGFVSGLLEAGREDEATAAVCHEMAHIRRRDYAMNLVCEAMAAPLKWHPVTYAVERRIYGTREMACDAMAARVMESDAEYARCLVGLAERMTTGGAMEQAGAMGLWNGNVLEERVMRLMETKTAMSARARVVRGAAGAAAMTAAVVLAGMVHVVPARAQAAAKEKVVAPATTPAPAKLTVVEPTVPAGPVVAVTEDKEVQPRILAGKDLPPVVVLTKQNVAAPKVLVLADARVDKASVPEVIELTRPELKTNVQVLTDVHGVIRLSKVAPMAAVAIPTAAVDPVPQAQAAPQAVPAPETTVKPAPAPTAAPAPGKESYEHHMAVVSRDGKLYVWENGKERELTPAERAKLEKQIDDAEKKIAAETARINSPQFKEQMEKSVQEAMDAQRKIQSGEIQKELAEAQKRLNSPEFKVRISEAQKKAMADVQKELNSAKFQAKMAETQRAAAAKVDSAQIQKEMADMEARLNSPEFKEQMQEAQRAAATIDSAQIQKEMADMAKRLNSPEFKKQIEHAQREAMDAQRKVMNGEIQKQMAEAQKELQKELDELKAQGSE
ncbi:MAG TPA: M56 family metallopeptidase [Acidobacteriaceae bacterium]|nr:M56 family metallopeptidase [Acidobacteriaceae bacterium]